MTRQKMVSVGREQLVGLESKKERETGERRARERERERERETHLCIAEPMIESRREFDSVGQWHGTGG